MDMSPSFNGSILEDPTLPAPPPSLDCAAPEHHLGLLGFVLSLNASWPLMAGSFHCYGFEIDVWTVFLKSLRGECRIDGDRVQKGP